MPTVPPHSISISVVGAGVGGGGAGGTGQQKATKSEDDNEGAEGKSARGEGVPVVEVRAGRQVGLECVVTKARPPAGVAWYRSGVKISQGGWVAVVLVP